MIDGDEDLESKEVFDPVKMHSSAEDRAMTRITYYSSRKVNGHHIHLIGLRKAACEY